MLALTFAEFFHLLLILLSIDYPIVSLAMNFVIVTIIDSIKYNLCQFIPVTHDSVLGMD